MNGTCGKIGKGSEISTGYADGEIRNHPANYGNIFNDNKDDVSDEKICRFGEVHSMQLGIDKQGPTIR